MSPAPTLRPFQTDAVNHVRSRRETLTVADPGLGKSVIALRAFEDQPRTLIVCNAAAMVSWPLLAAEWDRSGRPFYAIDTGDDVNWSVFGSALSATICVNYDLLGIRANTALREALRSWRAQAVVIDECQYIRSSGANRTRAILGVRCDGKKSLVESADHIAELSGTPMPNHAGELWTHYHALWTDQWRDVNGGVPLLESEWQDRYCKFRDTKYGRAFTGNRNVADLRQRMAPIVRRYKKADHATEMPALDFVDAPIRVDRADVARITAGFPPLLSLDDEEVMAILQAAPIASVRRSLGLAKVPGAVAWAIDKLESGCDKLILFAYHSAVIDQLRAGLLDYDPVVFDGGSLGAERRLAVSRFQGDPRCRVFIGQIVAAGTAITLTAAKTVGIVEASWTPAENYQAACRAHRIGQHDGVTAHFLFAPGTLDELIARTYRRKAREISDLFD